MSPYKDPFPPPADQLLPTLTPAQLRFRDEPLRLFQSTPVEIGTMMVSIIYTRNCEPALMAVREGRIVRVAPEFLHLPLNSAVSAKFVETRLEHWAGEIFARSITLDPRRSYIAVEQRVEGGQARTAALIEIDLQEVRLPPPMRQLLRDSARKISGWFYKMLQGEDGRRLFGVEFNSVIAAHTAASGGVLAHHYAIMWREHGQDSTDLSRSYMEVSRAPALDVADYASNESRRDGAGRPTINIHGRRFHRTKFSLLADTHDRSQPEYFMQSGYSFVADKRDPDSPRVILSALDFLSRLSFEQRAKLLRLINTDDDPGLSPVVTDVLRLMGTENTCRLAGTIAALTRQSETLATLAIGALSEDRQNFAMLADTLLEVGQEDLCSLVILLDSLYKLGNQRQMLLGSLDTIARKDQSLFTRVLILSKHPRTPRLWGVARGVLNRISTSIISQEEKETILEAATPIKFGNERSPGPSTTLPPWSGGYPETAYWFRTPNGA